jgi:hypothetical protein
MFFFELLQIALGNRDKLSHIPTRKEWIALYQESEKQSILGIMLDGLERLPEELRPPQDILLQWIGCVHIIEQNTIKISKASVEAVTFFQKNGFGCALLKGSAVGRYYPCPNRRQSGDIDVWLNSERESIYDFAKKFDKDGKLYGVNYQHIHFHLFPNIHLEVHIWPACLCNPLHNRRFHQFCAIHHPVMEQSMPCLAFDRVFILMHCFNHMCENGVGMRQIMDYYYVLKQGFTEDEKDDSIEWIKKLGMYRFASGLMWLMQYVFGMKDKYLLMDPNEKEGRFILQEVLMTGNMGHSDTRNWGSQKTAFKRFIHNLRRDRHLINHYPQEILFQPFFSLWLYFWRLSKGLLGSEDNDD